MNIFYWNKLLVAIEAMKYGKPVIASNRGALPEIIGNRVGGVFEFNNIIEQYKKDYVGSTQGDISCKFKKCLQLII